MASNAENVSIWWRHHDTLVHVKFCRVDEDIIYIYIFAYIISIRICVGETVNVSWYRADQKFHRSFLVRMIH